MIYDKPLELDDDPSVPDIVRIKLGRILKGARQVNVYEVPQSGRARKVNGLKLKQRRGQMPDVDLEDLALAVSRIMHAHWLDRAMEDGEQFGDAIKFRVSTLRDDEKVKQPSFEYKYLPDSIEGNDAYNDMAQLETMTLMALLDRYQMTDQLNVEVISDMQERFLRLAELNSAPIKAAGNQLEHANNLHLQGIQAILHAHERTSVYEMAKEQEAAKTERSRMMWERLEKIGEPLGKVAEQFTPWVVSKVTGVPIVQRRGQPSRPRPETHQKPSDQPETRTHQSGTRAAPNKEQDVDESNPIATVAGVFGDSIRAKQRREMKKSLTPGQLDTFEEIFCAENDEQAISMYKQLKAQLDVGTLLALNRILSKDQKEMFQGFTKLVEKAITKDPRPSEAEPEPEAKPEPTNDAPDDQQ